MSDMERNDLFEIGINRLGGRVWIFMQGDTSPAGAALTITPVEARIMAEALQSVARDIDTRSMKQSKVCRTTIHRQPTKAEQREERIKAGTSQDKSRSRRVPAEKLCYPSEDKPEPNYTVRAEDWQGNG